MWLTQDEIAYLFDSARSTITYHINNIYTNDELDKNTSVEKFDEMVDHRPVKLQNLDVVLPVGNRVNSKRGIAFRRWANKVLKDYLVKVVKMKTVPLALFLLSSGAGDGNRTRVISLEG